MVHQRKLQDKQKAKILQLIENTDIVPMMFLVWLIVMQLLMPLHYRLFKRGIFYNHMQAKPHEEQRFACFECCDMRRSPAVKSLAAIALMMYSPVDSHFAKLLLLKYGDDSSTWPLAMCVALHVSLVLAYARLWRLLVFYFEQYPWKVAKCMTLKQLTTVGWKPFLSFWPYPRGPYSWIQGWAGGFEILMTLRATCWSVSCMCSCAHSF